MYEQTLPSSPDSIAGAQAWIKTIALTHQPSLADAAERAVAEQVAIALRRTPPRSTIALTADATNTALIIRVRDPGQPLTAADGPEWAELSTLAYSFRSQRSATGHTTEVELRRQPAAS